MSQESSIARGFKKVGHAIDAGVSGVVRGLGGTIRIHCPSCKEEIESPPDIVVQCPRCHQEFHSPTFSERSMELGSQWTESGKQGLAKTREEGGRNIIGHKTTDQPNPSTKHMGVPGEEPVTQRGPSKTLGA
jgi:hypothetical protein